MVTAKAASRASWLNSILYPHPMEGNLKKATARRDSLDHSHLLGVTWDIVLIHPFPRGPRGGPQTSLSHCSWMCPWACVWVSDTQTEALRWDFQGRVRQLEAAFLAFPQLLHAACDNGYQGWNSSSHSENTLQFNMHKMTCVQVFAAALFIIANCCNWLQYLPGGDQLSSLQFSHNRDYSVAIKKKEVSLLRYGKISDIDCSEG